MFTLHFKFKMHGLAIATFGVDGALNNKQVHYLQGALRKSVWLETKRGAQDE